MLLSITILKWISLSLAKVGSTCAKSGVKMSGGDNARRGGAIFIIHHCHFHFAVHQAYIDGCQEPDSLFRLSSSKRLVV